MTVESFFSAKGRLRRKDYLIRAFFLAVPIAFLEEVYSTISSPFQVFACLIIIVCAVLFIMQAIKRLHDINKSGWYWLVSIIPIVNIVFGLYIIFKDGTVGPNLYGDDPKGRILAS